MHYWQYARQQCCFYPHPWEWKHRRQETPKYEEMCRRFLADAADFSAEKLEMAGITQVFENDDLERCVQEIEEHLLSALR